GTLTSRQRAGRGPRNRVLRFGKEGLLLEVARRWGRGRGVSRSRRGCNARAPRWPARSATCEEHFGDLNDSVGQLRVRQVADPRLDHRARDGEIEGLKDLRLVVVS